MALFIKDCDFKEKPIENKEFKNIKKGTITQNVIVPFFLKNQATFLALKT
jgi:hypothetical protein